LSLRLVLKSTPGLAGPESCVSSSPCRCQTTPSVGAQIRPIAPIAGEVDSSESQTGPSTKLGSLPGRRVAAVAAPGSEGFAPALLVCKAMWPAALSPLPQLVCLSRGGWVRSRCLIIPWRLGPLTVRPVVAWRLGPLTLSLTIPWRLGPLTVRLMTHHVAIRSAHAVSSYRGD
jgi:hypothetical protein